MGFDIIEINLVLYQIQRDKPDQAEEHEDLSDCQVPNISQTLFVKEAEALPGTLVSELPAITSFTEPTQKVCQIPIYHKSQRYYFQIISSPQLDHEDNENKIKIIRMMGKIWPFSNQRFLFSIAEKKIVPCLFILFAVIYWSFSFLCYYDFITHFTDID